MLHSDGTLAGLATEVDRLNHIFKTGHDHTPEETISDIIQPAEAAYSSSAPFEATLPAFGEDQVVLVIEADRPVGILTEIDVLDFIAKQTAST